MGDDRGFAQSAALGDPSSCSIATLDVCLELSTRMTYCCKSVFWLRCLSAVGAGVCVCVCLFCCWCDISCGCRVCACVCVCVCEREREIPVPEG